MRYARRGMLEVVEVELVPGLVVGGKWRLERAIGQGGFGVVWAAVDVKTGAHVALKCLTKEGASDGKRQERLRREARAMASIAHPHIARVFGLEELPSVDDTRTCTACMGTPSDGTCGTQFGTRGNELNCPSVPSPTDKQAGTTCTASASAVIDLQATIPAGTCTTTAGLPSGEAKSIEPVTFCCNTP